MSVPRKDRLIGPFLAREGSASLAAVSMGYTISRDSTQDDTAIENRLLGDWDRKNASITPFRNVSNANNTTALSAQLERLHVSSPAEWITPQTPEISISSSMHRGHRQYSLRNDQSRLSPFAAQTRKRRTQDLTKPLDAFHDETNLVIPPSTWSRLENASQAKEEDPSRAENEGMSPMLEAYLADTASVQDRLVETV